MEGEEGRRSNGVVSSAGSADASEPQGGRFASFKARGSIKSWWVVTLLRF